MWEKIVLFLNRGHKEDIKATDEWEENTLVHFLWFVLIICAWLCLGTRQGFCLAFVLGGLQGLRAKTSLLKIARGWGTASAKQARLGTFLSISCSVSSWEKFGRHHHTEVSSRCLLWSPSLASLCRWLRTKGLMSQFGACSCFFSAVTNNDCTNLKANMQWKKLFLGALFQGQR